MNDDTTLDANPTAADGPTESAAAPTMETVLKEADKTSDRRIKALGQVAKVLEKGKTGAKIDRKGFLTALTGLQSCLIDLDGLVRAALVDIFQMTTEMQKLAINLFQDRTRMTVLIETLFKKQLITEEELIATWKEVVAPQLQEAVQENVEETKE